MKNDLRQSVDRAFAGAAWDETHARRVISKIEERKQPVMKRKLTAALVCALVLVLASACALASLLWVLFAANIVATETWPFSTKCWPGACT